MFQAIRAFLRSLGGPLPGGDRIDDHGTTCTTGRPLPPRRPAPVVHAPGTVPVYNGREHEFLITPTLAALVVEHVDPRGIHRSHRTVQLDGCHVHDLARTGIPGLSPRDAHGLEKVGEIALAAAALTFAGDICIEADEATVARAQERGEAVGFEHAELIMQLAANAARVSGRRMSGTLIRA